MKVNKGDKVRFLNATGGGIVSRIEGKTIFVEDEDGFEMPVMENEVVLIEARAAQKAEAEVRRQEEKRNEVPEVAEDYSYQYAETKEDDQNPRFYIAFTQSDNGKSGYVDLHAVNDSNYFVLFTLTQLAADGKGEMLHYGTIEPNTKLMLDKYSPQRIDNQTWRVQLILFKKSRQFNQYPPVSTDIKIRSQKFFRDNSFAVNDFFDQKAVVMPVIKTELDVKMEQLQDPEIMKAIAQKEAQQKPKQSRKNVNEIIEVDLHIDQILDTTAGLSNGEMLQVQLARFRHVMEEYMERKGQRIVFIHGVGNGTLKTELRKILDREYKKLNYQDASFREYGYGATMVVM